MAIDSTIQVVHDGTVNATLMLTGLCDGSDGNNETNTLKVDTSSLTPTGGRLQIWEIAYDVSAVGTAVLYWEATPPVRICTMTNTGNIFNFEKEGGLPNPADETATGNILLTTLDYDRNSSYTVILRMKKRFT